MSEMPRPAGPLLRIGDLEIATRSSRRPVLRRLSLEIGYGETLAVVGESGCGKTVTSLAIMGLLPPALAVTGGSIRFAGDELTRFDAGAMRRLRGRRIGMVFQDPMSALNPMFTVGDQIVEMIRAHDAIGRSAARRRALDLLDEVRLPNPARLIDEYPHRLSGGQRQRVVIAIAIANRPDLVIADEPTTALDATIQAQIMALLKSLQQTHHMAVMLITHNFGLVAGLADRVAVMYAGAKVEEAPVEAIFAAPRHPYTRGLLAATPRPGRVRADGRPLEDIPGMVPSFDDLPRGCPFAPRCAQALEICRRAEPCLHRSGERSLVACFAATAQ